LSFEERIVLLLAMMPHIAPQSLDAFFTQNATFNRPFSEFGGWKGTSHAGFLPTGETAAFLLAVNNWEKRNEVLHLFKETHWFYQRNVLHLYEQGPGEPFLSGRLCLSEVFLAKVYT